jgi:CheY-like chemotaxis protein
VATRRSGDSLQVVVQDSGPALPEARQASLFDPAGAATTEALNLPVADIIARQHGGNLSVRSQEGLGNAFLLDLPCAVQPTPASAPASAAGAVGAAALEAPGSGASRGLQGAKALVVDDETFLLECLVDALGVWGMEVSSCTRGDDAIEKLNGGEFDVIVSDIRMPGLSGVDLFDWLKDHRAAMTRRILYTTGDSFDAKTREFLEGNQVPFLGKPFDLKQLKQSLERLLEIPIEA